MIFHVWSWDHEDASPRRKKMFQSSDLFKHIECPFFKHDLCHRPYCHFKHFKPKKEKERSVAVSEADQGGISEANDAQKIPPPATPTQASPSSSSSPSPFSSPSDYVLNEEILRVIKEFKTNPSPAKGDGASEDILDMVLKYKSDHPLSTPTTSPNDSLPDNILNIVMNISPSKVLSHQQRLQANEELQQLLDQVDQEGLSGSFLSSPCSSNGTGSSIPPLPPPPPLPMALNTEPPTTTIITIPQTGDAALKGGLIDSFYNKEKVLVHITSGDVATTLDFNAESKPTEADSGSKRVICCCHDPDCSGFLDEDDDKQLTHVNSVDSDIDLDKIEDDYMRRKMERRLQRKRQLINSEAPPASIPIVQPTPPMNNNAEDDFAFSVPPGLDEALTSVLEETNQAFSKALPGGDEDNPVNLDADSDDIYEMDEPIVFNVDINEADFFIPVPQPEPEPAAPLTPEEAEEIAQDDDLSAYIDKCKADYAKKKGEEKKKKKKKISKKTSPSLSMGDGREIEVPAKRKTVSNNGDLNRKETKKEPSKEPMIDESNKEIKKVDSMVVLKNESKKEARKGDLTDDVVQSDSKRVLKTDMKVDPRKRNLKSAVSKAEEPAAEKGKVEQRNENKENTVEVAKQAIKRVLPNNHPSDEGTSEEVSEGEVIRRKDKMTKKKQQTHMVTFADEMSDDNDSNRTEERKEERKDAGEDKDLKASLAEKKKKEGDKGDGKLLKRHKSRPVSEDQDTHDKAEIRSEKISSSGKIVKDREEKTRKTGKVEQHERMESKANRKMETSKSSKSSATPKGESSTDVGEKRSKDRRIYENDSNHRLDRIEKVTKETQGCKIRVTGVKKELSRTDSESSSTSATGMDVIAISSSEEEHDSGSLEPQSDVGSEHGVVSDVDEEETYPLFQDELEDAAVEACGQGKKRVALTNEPIHRKPVQPHKSKSMKMSYVSPNVNSVSHVSKSSTQTTKASKLVAPVLKSSSGAATTTTTKTITSPLKPTPNTSSPANLFYNTGKKRVSLVKPVEKTDSQLEKERRPKLAMDIGGKIPHLIRTQHYNRIIDNLLPKCSTDEEAYEKATAEEIDAYNRASRKPIYHNLCANIVKRLRGMPDCPRLIDPPPADPMVSAKPTVKSIPKSKTVGSTENITSADMIKYSNKVQQSSSSTKANQVNSKINGPQKSLVSKVSESRLKSSVVSGYQKIENAATIPKNSIKPASSSLVKATENKVPIAAKRSASSTGSIGEPLQLTEENFYDHMKQYLLTDDQMWENKYPQRDKDNPNLTLIKDYVPSDNPLKRECCRCGKEYFMNQKGKYVTRNECHFHWGKLLRQRGRNASHAYTCCGADSDGATCSMCRLHVCNRVGPLLDYVSTDSCSNPVARRKVYALDCEMCYTTQGLELTRLTVIDFDLKQTTDLFVKPSNPIVDYNTRFSGVSREDLTDVTTTIKDIHGILLNMFDKDTILMGHSLESDLNALNLIHRKVVDTALVFPHRLGLPFKRALRNLMAEYLQRVIQSGEGGHDSCEDARSCMELMRYKFKEDQKRKRLKT